MAADDPASDRWSRYWRAIRRGLWVVLVLGVVFFVTGLLEPAVRTYGGGVALVAVIGVVLVAAAKLLIDRLAGLRRDRP